MLDGIGAVVGPLQRGDDTTLVHPDEGDAQEVPRELLQLLAARVVLARQRKNRSI